MSPPTSGSSSFNVASMAGALRGELKRPSASDAGCPRTESDMVGEASRSSNRTSFLLGAFRKKGVLDISGNVDLMKAVKLKRVIYLPEQAQKSDMPLGSC